MILTDAGGWDAEGNIPASEEDQIANAFVNIEKALKAAGIKRPFESIYSIHSYHVGLHDGVLTLMPEHFRKLIPTHQPLWTMLGVQRLGLEEMKVEIEVVAIID